LADSSSFFSRIAERAVALLRKFTASHARRLTAEAAGLLAAEHENPELA
jgi:hypothetical protein